MLDTQTLFAVSLVFIEN